MPVLSILILICFCGAGFFVGCESRNQNVVPTETNIILEKVEGCDDGICPPPPEYK